MYMSIEISDSWLFLCLGTSFSQFESNDSTSMPISKCKYLDMPTAKHREKVMSVYFLMKQS